MSPPRASTREGRAGAIYRRWRPQTFGDVVGQEHVTRTLRNAVKSGRVAHGYLFCGPRGVAKTSTARILAKAINCLNSQDGEPCNECELCQSIAEGTSYDVIEMDAASNGLVDNVRDLRQHVMTHPDQARRKVYILDEAHRMSAPAFDALLKTLEEPPEHVVFVLVTSEPERIPATIVSRCQRFDFRRLPQRGIVTRLAEICEAEKVEIEPAALDLVARAATGSMRDAQSVLDQLCAMGGDRITLADVEAVLGTGGTAAAAQLAEAVVRRDQAAGLRLINQVVADGADPRQFCRDVTDYLRAVLLLKLGGPDDALDVSAETLAQMGALAKEAETASLLRAVKLFGQADVGWRGTLHFQLPLELAFVESTLGGEEKEAGAPSASPSLPSGPRMSFRAERGISAGTSAAGAPKPAEPAATVEIPRRSAPRDDKGRARADSDDATPPVSEAPERPLVSDADLFAEIERRWSEVRDALPPNKPWLRAVLGHAGLGGLHGDRLVLETTQPSYQREITSQRNQAPLEETIGRVFGRKLRIGCIVVDQLSRLNTSEPSPLDEAPIRAAIQRGWRAKVVEEGGGEETVQ